MSSTDHSPATSIHEQWERYLELVVPRNAHSTQVRETKRAFYSGCWVMMQTQLYIGQDSISEEDSVKILEKAHQDITKEIANQILNLKFRHTTSH